MVNWDLGLRAFPEFPGRDWIGHRPQADLLPLGSLFQILPFLAYRIEADVIINPGEA